MATKKTVLVTGCSANGIGAALAHELTKQGHFVFATARNTSKIPPELRDNPNVVSVLELDVTSGSSVAAAAQAVRDAGHGLDVLVNNAGLGYSMPLLDVDVAKAQNLYEANLWGPLRMIQALADLLIASRGTIVNVSTVGSVLSTPWIGPYASSKAALNVLSETLRMELSPFGVRVVTIMTGTIATPFHANEPDPVLPPQSRYAPILDFITRWAKGETGPKGEPVAKFVQSIMQDVVGERNGVVWRGAYSGLIKFIVGWAPTFIIDAGLTIGQGLSELRKSLHNKSD